MGIIRRADIKDIEQVYHLIKELEQIDIDIVSFRKIYVENISNSQVHYYLYDNNGDIDGFISVHIQSLLHHASHIAEIQEFVVKENMQGKGLGVQLFNKAVQIAKECDCEQIEVSCNQNRKLSHVFYTNRGMKNNHFKFSKPL